MIYIQNNFTTIVRVSGIRVDLGYDQLIPGEVLTFHPSDLVDNYENILNNMPFIDYGSEPPSTPVVTTTPQGPGGGGTGANGESAYQLAVDNGFIGTVTEWLASLQGPQGESGSNAAVFALDVVSLTNNVGFKTYKPNTVPTNVNIASATTDGSNVTINIGAGGAAAGYSPNIVIGGIPVTNLVESSTKRWFTGSAIVPLELGLNIIPIVADGEQGDSVEITLVGAGPSVLSVIIGAYPGTQTTLKAGDVVPVTVTTDSTAVNVTLSQTGVIQPITLPVTNGYASGTITIGSDSGSQTFNAVASSLLGTPGASYTSPVLNLDQVYPVISVLTITYPNGKEALNSGDTAQVSSVVTNFDKITYSSSLAAVPNSTTYQISKNIINTATGYKYGVNDYSIVATRNANGASSSQSAAISVATIAPTASIQITGNPAELPSSPTGIPYEVQIYPNQVLLSPPSLTASLGMWSGNWTFNNNYWSRNLVISDSTARGNGLFSSLQMTGLSGISGTVITSGSNYIVGGFSTRTITYPAFARVAALGVNIYNPANVSVQISGGNNLTLASDNGIYSNEWYPALSDGTYSATGNYIGLSDSVFAGSNTSGTLQVIVSEVA